MAAKQTNTLILQLNSKLKYVADNNLGKEAFSRQNLIPNLISTALLQLDGLRLMGHPFLDPGESFRW